MCSNTADQAYTHMHVQEIIITMCPLLPSATVIEVDQTHTWTAIKGSRYHLGNKYNQSQNEIPHNSLAFFSVLCPLHAIQQVCIARARHRGREYVWICMCICRCGCALYLVHAPTSRSFGVLDDIMEKLHLKQLLDTSSLVANVCTTYSYRGVVWLNYGTHRHGIIAVKAS